MQDLVSISLDDNSLSWSSGTDTSSTYSPPVSSILDFCIPFLKPSVIVLA